MFSIIPRLIAEEIGPAMRMAEELSRYPLALARYAPAAVNHMGEAEVHNTDHELRIRMDLKHFKPEEIEVKSDPDHHRLTVSAKHEEKQDKEGFIARQLTRTFKLPENLDAKSVTSTMNEHGILNIRIEKKALEPPKETQIPVKFE